MNWFEKIKKYYDASLWTGKMVGNAVAKKKITAEQYKKITWRGLQQVRVTGIYTLDRAEARKGQNHVRI